MSKKRIEFLEDNLPGWIEGYITTIEHEDDENYYFNDEWDRWCYIEKSKEGTAFKIYQPRQRIKYDN